MLSPQSEERFTRIPPRIHEISGRSTGDSTNTSAIQQTSAASRNDGLTRSTPALPSLASLTSEVDNAREQPRPSSPTPWRPLGVHSILNPTSEAQAIPSQTVPPSPQTSVVTGPHGSHAAPTSSPYIRKRGEPHSPPNKVPSQQEARTGRRMLTPRSPIVRAASLGAHRSPSVGGGLITRIPHPSGDGRGYTVEPGDSQDAPIPPLPPLSAAARGAHSTIQSRELVSPAPRNTATNAPFIPHIPVLQHQENHPEHPRPPYLSSEAPLSGFPPSHGQMPSTPAGAGGESQPAYMSSTLGPVRSTMPIDQNQYHLQFETPTGSMVVPVNVDFQQASRLADEKRKRNAGASARFRARRKEKEREANQTISGLQQELAELLEEREFYLHERNFFRDLLARTNPGPLPVRPHSPSARRAHPVSSATPETSQSVEYGLRELDPPGSQRRRTGDYQPSMTSQSPSTTYNPPFPTPGSNIALPTPPTQGNYPVPHPGPPGPPPPTSRPPPHFDPLRRNISDREWNAGR